MLTPEEDSGGHSMMNAASRFLIWVNLLAEGEAWGSYVGGFTVIGTDQRRPSRSCFVEIFG